MATLRMKLEGEHGTITASTISRALKALSDLVSTWTEEKVPAPIVTELSLGSVLAGVEAPPGMSEDLRDGIMHVQQNGDVPADWPDTRSENLKAVLKVGDAKDLTGIQLSDEENSILVTYEFLDILEGILETASRSYSSISGRLFGYSNPNTSKKTLKGYLKPNFGSNITLEIPQLLADRAAELIEKNVEVWGLAERNKDATHIKSMLIDGIEEMPVPSIRPSAASLRGLWASEKESGEDSVEMVRALRDQW